MRFSVGQLGGADDRIGRLAGPCPLIPPAAIVISTLGLFLGTGGAHAQDMEPRAFSASPVDTNFLIANYTRITGSPSLDPSLPVTGGKATINQGTFAYDHTFDLFGQTASAAIALPYVQADLSGQVEQQGREITRSGLGDMRLRFTENLIGNPALTPQEFAQREPTTTLGVSLTILAPTGDYNSAHLINISSNRWAFKPEVGMSQPIGDWFSDAAAGVWLFTDNTDFFHGHVRGEDPLWVFQTHAGYNFQPGLWLAADFTYYTGGDTSIDGGAKHDAQAVSRYGLTLSVPFGEGFSAKLAWSSWLTAHKGGNFDTFGVTFQYRWFD